MQSAQSRPHLLIPIYGQLRSLLIEKSRGKKSLLLDIADTIGANMNIYVQSKNWQNLEISSSDQVFFLNPVVQKETQRPKIKVCGIPFSSVRTNENQEKISLTDFLDFEVLEYEGEKLKVNEILGFYANRYGGSHYDHQIPENFAKLLSEDLGGFDILKSMLVSIAQLILDNGISVLKNISCSTVFLCFYLYEQQLSEKSILMDSMYPQSPMRYSLILDNGRIPHLIVRGANNVKDVFTLSKQLDFNDWAEFCISIQLNDRLQSNVLVVLNGEEVVNITLERNIEIYNHFRNCDRYLNTSADQSKMSGIDMGVVQYAGALETNWYEIAGAVGVLKGCRESEEPVKVIKLSKSSYLNMKPGSFDLEIIGEYETAFIKNKSKAQK